MSGPIGAFLEADHARLDGLLASAVTAPGAVAPEPFAAFRAGLLRHIALEEKILLPAAHAARGGVPLPAFRRLRIDHGAIAALLVAPPTPALVAELRSILVPHDWIEEADGGVYDACDALLAGEAEQVLERLQAYPPVRVAPHRDGPRVVRTAAEALRVSAQQLAVR
jgi:hypothetical protein